MAHMIDESTGKAAVFVTGEPAWHKLGTVIEQAANSTDAIKLAGLDWTIEQWPMRAFNPDDHSVEAGCPGRVANVRTDTKACLGIVSTGYTVFQNAEAFDFMDTIVGEKLAMYETAGSLDAGKRVWMLARIPKEHRAGPEDVIHPYVLLTNSHDGSQALRMIPTSVRVVCNNTLTLALRYAGTEGLSIYHFASLHDRVREARQKLGLIAARFDQFDEELHALISHQMTGDELGEYFDDLLPVEKHGHSDRTKKFRDNLTESWNANFEDPKQKLPGIAGSAWAAYNAVSDWADHEKPVRGENARDKANNQLKSIWFGSANRVKQRAYSSALGLATA